MENVYKIEKKGSEKMFKHLTDKDIEEGKELVAIISNLTESEKMQVRIYTQALVDRSELLKIAAGAEAGNVAG